MNEIDLLSILFSILIGGLVGFTIRVTYDVLKTPKLEIDQTVNEPYLIGSDYRPNSFPGPNKNEFYNAYRVRVYNKERKLLGEAARNCVAWLEIEGALESYQLSWVGELSSVIINIGDYREINLCAREVHTGVIVAPTERGYFEPRPRSIDNGKRELKGKIRVTCENGRKDTMTLVIIPRNRDQLNIKIEKSMSKSRTPRSS